MVNAVRNLTVGENSGDRPLSNHSANDSGVRKASREESSDSEEPKKSNRRETRDKRHEKKRSEERDRYSPDAYKDKRYEKKRYRDRRYEDDTEDYYSDKEKDRRRSERDYERKYGSLRKVSKLHKRNKINNTTSFILLRIKNGKEEEGTNETLAILVIPVIQGNHVIQEIENMPGMAEIHEGTTIITIGMKMITMMKEHPGLLVDRTRCTNLIGIPEISIREIEVTEIEIGIENATEAIEIIEILTINIRYVFITILLKTNYL